MADMVVDAVEEEPDPVQVSYGIISNERLRSANMKFFSVSKTELKNGRFYIAVKAHEQGFYTDR